MEKDLSAEQWRLLLAGPGPRQALSSGRGGDAH
jgi:hypothetical protein